MSKKKFDLARLGFLLWTMYGALVFTIPILLAIPAYPINMTTKVSCVLEQPPYPEPGWKGCWPIMLP